MNGYEIGKQYEGRIAFKDGGNLIVELDHQKLGKVLNWDFREPVSVGSTVLVEALQDKGDELLLDFVSVQDAQKLYNHSRSWNNWAEMPIGHFQVLTALSSLRSHTDNTREKLQHANAKWNEAKETNRKSHDFVR